MERLTLFLCTGCAVIGLIAVYAASLFTAAPSLAISELSEDMVGATVEVSGAVVDLREHQNGHLFIKLQDESGGVVSIPLFSDIRSGVGRIEVLDTLAVRGEVSVYKGELEVIPSSPSDVTVHHAPPISPSELSENRYGTLVKVAGKIAKIRRLPGGQAILSISDGRAEVDVFLPKNVASSVDWLAEGLTVKVGGWYQLYNGGPEIKVLDRACLIPADDNA